MKNLSWIVALMFMMFLSNCGNNEFQPSSEEQCKVGRFVYKQSGGMDYSYNILYNEQKAINLITDEVFQSGGWVTNSTYRHLFRNDSLIVKDFTGFREGATLLTALTGTKISEVKRFLPGGFVYRWRFDYTKANQVGVTLDKMDGELATADSRAVYYFDENSDVTRMEKFKAGSPDVEVKFTYDIVINPLKDLVLPHFLEPKLPDVTFFSMRNRITEETSGVKKEYKFTYGTDPMPAQVVTPDGTVLKFDYPNCTN